MDIVRDLLDKKVVDRHGREMGRVDGVVVHVHDGAPPRVVALELGPAVLADRLHPVLGRLVAGLERALGVDDGRPLRIPVEAILDASNHVKVDLAFGETAASTIELRLRRWIGGIPGAS